MVCQFCLDFANTIRGAEATVDLKYMGFLVSTHVAPLPTRYPSKDSDCYEILVISSFNNIFWV